MSFAVLEPLGTWEGRERVPVGVIGCGVVSNVFMRTLCLSQVVALKSCASRSGVSAATQAAKFGAQAVDIEALLADPEIRCVVILAPPAAHYDLCRRALEAGKHVFSEKPLTTSLDEAHSLAKLAAGKGLRIGCAPDTFLGWPHQQARRLIDSGAIGRVTGGALTVASHGMEHWHPSPQFFYQHGGGPVLDVGIYPVTQLVNLLGPIARVTALSSMPATRRLITSKPLAGTHLDVSVPTTFNGALQFESGANVSLTMSWDVWKHRREPLELYGDEGTLINPDPNFFFGSVRISRRNGEWEEPAEERREDDRDRELAKLGGPRGLGVIDLVLAAEQGRAPRTDIGIVLHVLEVLLAIERSAAEGRAIDVTSRCARPLPL